MWRFNMWRRVVLLALPALVLLACSNETFFSPWAKFGGTAIPIGYDAIKNAKPGIDFVPGEVIVKLRKTIDVNDVADLVRGSVKTKILEVGDYAYYRISVERGREKEVFKKLWNTSYVANVQLNYIYKLIDNLPDDTGNDPYADNSEPTRADACDLGQGCDVDGRARPPDPDYVDCHQYGARITQLDRAWCEFISRGLPVGSRHVLAVVIDTGINALHYDLRDQMAEGYAYYGTQGLGNNVAEPINPPDVLPPVWDSDGHMHGTHVAGIIGAAEGNGVGGVGNIWHVLLSSHRVFPAGAGGAADDPIIRAIRDAADRMNTFTRTTTGYELVKVVVMNMSLGGRFWDLGQMDIINYAISKGASILAAAGNDTINFIGFPAAYPGVIAIGATDGSDRPAFFTSKGTFVSVAAPGVNIWSTYAKGSTLTEWINLSGTSMATPFATGIAALILAAALELNPNHIALTPLELKSILELTADDLGTPGYDTTYGWGRINAYRAIQMAINWDRTQDVGGVNESPNCIYGVLRVDVRDTDNLSPINNAEVIVLDDYDRVVAVTRTEINPGTYVTPANPGAYFYNLRVNPETGIGHYKVRVSYKGRTVEKDVYIPKSCNYLDITHSTPSSFTIGGVTVKRVLTIEL